MNTDEAKRIVTKLRRWTYWRDMSQSDLELLRSQADAYENVSFILVIMWCGTRHNLASWSWWDLGLIGVLAFLVYCRLQMAKLRKAIRLFEAKVYPCAHASNGPGLFSGILTTVKVGKGYPFFS